MHGFRIHKGIGHNVCRYLYRFSASVHLVMILQFHVVSFGQVPTELKFDRLSTENTIKVKGLSQNSIYCLLQDYKGFIWIGTWDGLNKYDGYDFLIYNGENGLSNNTINALMEDQDKHIWIGTENGLNLFDRSKGTFDHFLHQPGNPNSLSHNFINHLAQDDRGYIWIGSAYGLSRFDKKLKVFKNFHFFERGQDSLRTNFITRVFQDSRGWLWIGTKNGLHCYDLTQQSFKHYKFSNGERLADQLLINTISDIEEDRYGTLYIATLKGIFLVDAATGVHQRMVINGDPTTNQANRRVNDLFIDGNGLIWIGTNDGLEVYDPVSRKRSIFNAGGGSTSLSNNDIQCIYEDQSGTKWIGTYSGLNKIDQSPARFTHFYHDPDKLSGLNDHIVYAIVEDSAGRAWVGTYGGVNIYNRMKDQYSLIQHDPARPNSLSSNKIRNIVFSENGFAWIGTESSGLNRLEIASGKVTRYCNDLQDSLSLSDNFIVSMISDSKGRVWAGTANGLDLIDPYSGKLTRLSQAPYRLKLNDNYICSIYEDRQGYFWIGTLQGLHKLSPDLKEMKIYLNDPLNPNSMCPNRVFSTLQDRNGIYWFGTMGGGLIRYNPDLEEFRSFTEADGLPNNVVYATLEDDEGHLWISSNNGLSRFNPRTQTFVNYDTRDGIQGNEFNAGAYFKNPQGEMYFGGMNGFNVFHPREIFFNQVPPRVVLTRFMVLNESIDDDLEGGEVFRLGYNQNVFSIEFSALDYTNPQKNLYRYKLENFEENWNHAGAGQRRADYRNMGPGTYRFIVYGSNNDGVWNTTGISLTLVIRPPWWMSNLFRVSVLLLLVFIIWIIIYFRFKVIKRKGEVEKMMLEIEKQVFETEQKALQLQMNPHFIFNSLNAIQNFILSNDTDKAVNYLSRFSHLMRMILANSSVSMINLKDELKALTYYLDLEKLRFDNKFNYVIHKDDTIDEEFILIPPMLFQPFVENAVIHGFVNSMIPGKLEITFKHHPPDRLTCIIEDNGIGREKASEIRAASGIKRQPRGLMITQERIELLKKQSRKDFSIQIIDLKDEQGQPTGTRVEITIQYKEL